MQVVITLKMEADNALTLASFLNQHGMKATSEVIRRQVHDQTLDSIKVKEDDKRYEDPLERLYNIFD